MNVNYLPILVYIVLVICFACITVLLSSLLGPRNPTLEKLMTYECGMDPRGEGIIRFSVKFYVIAMLFVVFDIEAVFLFPWAVIFKQLGLFGFIEMAVFVFFVLAGLIYVWRKGALEWE